MWSDWTEGAEGNAKKDREEPRFFFEEKAWEEEELTEVGEAESDMDVVCEDVEGGREACLDNACGAIDPLSVEIVELERCSDRANMYTKIGSSSANFDL